MELKLKPLAPLLAFSLPLIFTNQLLSAKITPETRAAAAVAQLTGKPNHVAVYTRGFVCDSCGIGARIHLSKIDGIDASTFERGVKMDAEKQLLYIAFKPGIEPDLEAVRRAIQKAGYEPDRYYLWSESGFVTAPFQSPK